MNERYALRECQSGKAFAWRQIVDFVNFAKSVAKGNSEHPQSRGLEYPSDYSVLQSTRVRLNLVRDTRRELEQRWSPEERKLPRVQRAPYMHYCYDL